MCINNVWGTVCSDNEWGDDEAEVVCNQLQQLYRKIIMVAV